MRSKLMNIYQEPDHSKGLTREFMPLNHDFLHIAKSRPMHKTLIRLREQMLSLSLSILYWV